MIKTLNPYPNTAKTAEIMSRYRPIAPKPETPTSPTGDATSMSRKIRQSPYLRNLWPQLQARPTRTRKRGRAALSPPTFKRQRTINNTLGLSPPPPTYDHHLPPLQGFSIHSLQQIPITSLASEKSTSALVTLPLLPSTPIVANQGLAPEPDWIKPSGEEKKLIDLNTVAEIPEEKDLLQQLQRVPVPVPAPAPTTCCNVIAPQPVRPVGSSICVRCISEDPKLASQAAQAPKKPEEVEDEVESEILPAVISDSNNKVRMANSAYKEMVGQPECSWLDLMMMTSSCKRIGGEVVLQISDAGLPVSSNGFRCWVRIEWGSDENKNSVNAFCEVIRLSCESKDYVFTWRFHIHHTREASQSSCNV